MTNESNYCRYLIMVIYLKDNYITYKCACNDVAAANCLKDGICPIYEDRLKTIEELTKGGINEK